MNINTKIKLLTACIFLVQQSHALEQIQDNDLGQVTGQDGISITHQVNNGLSTDNAILPAIEIEKLNWYDPNQNKDIKMGLGLHNVKVYAEDQNALETKISFDVGATDAGAGIKLDASVSPFTAKADLKLVKIKDIENDPTSIRTKGTESNQSLGKFSLSTKSPFSVVLRTTAGLFNKNELASIDFNLQDASLKHSLENNSLVFSNFNFNFAGQGYIYIDPKEGIVLTSNNGTTDNFIVLESVQIKDSGGDPTGANTAGVNFDLRYQNDNGELKNIMRYGISGTVKNARLAVSANQNVSDVAPLQTPLSSFNVSNKERTERRIKMSDNQIKTIITESEIIRADTAVTDYNVGSGGLHLNLSADFTNKTELEGKSFKDKSLKATTLEIGHTGRGSYSVQFQNLRSLTGENAAYIDFGDIYINTLEAGSLSFLINEKLKRTLDQSSNLIIQDVGGKNNQNQQINKDVVLIAIRDMDFQSIASKANFISNDTSLPTSNSGSWGIGIPIYNLNTNIALSGTKYNNKEAIAYNLIASTQGYGIDKVTGAPSTTSIILIDGEVENGHARNYYAGLRNIDAFVQSDGVIAYEQEGIHIDAKNLVIAANAELAIGRLPGTTYSYESNDILVDNNNNPILDNNGNQQKVIKQTTVPLDNFSNRNDVLTNIAFKLDGSGNLFIIPGVNPTTANPDTNFLSLKGDFKFRPLANTNDPNILGSYFSLSNIDEVEVVGQEVNNSNANVESPTQNFKSIQTSAISLNKMQGHIDFDARIKVKEDKVVLDNQIGFNHNKDIAQPFRTNFAMQVNDKMQNMASIAITGGAMRSTMSITPR
ncbi:hypothetical protein BS636_08735 [Acinetobacter sp. LoGeW2-3]|uniref:hypothetical protein n=1 Tax=Acinetobacter sp. LoGeW2-3 TaxID=1808001 RepID=UPI000C059D4D|nr:hypothetical protein [Acinetobacter sp. LoGeW2-3]ATO19734.1 hypothetical protein BS636_08735 [Acinetobacter sp. LoGeW2-3]